MVLFHRLPQGQQETQHI